MDSNENHVKFTPEQNAAISYRDGSLLVSSAAGSGKTMVIVERLIKYIDEGFDIDDFLIITYSRAAAIELREKILEKLYECLTISPNNKRYRRQLTLIRGANIDTIHAFCISVLRENAHLVGLPLDFRVADESE